MASTKKFKVHSAIISLARRAAANGESVHMKEFTRTLRNEYVDSQTIMSCVKELASGYYVDGCALRHAGRGQYELVEFAPKHEVTTVVVLSKEDDNVVVDVVVLDGRIIEEDAIAVVRKRLVKEFTDEDTDCTESEWRAFVKEHYELVVRYSEITKF